MTSRLVLSLALLPLVATFIAEPAFAGTRENVLVTATRCAGITDDRSWLDCYYGAAQPMRAQLGLTPAPAAQLAKVPGGQAPLVPSPATPPPMAKASAPAPRQGFLDRLFGGSDTNVMKSYKFDAHGMFTVTLDNGEVWQQQAYDANLAHWRDNPSKYNISVMDHSGNSQLTVDNDGQIYQVRRVN